MFKFENSFTNSFNTSSHNTACHFYEEDNNIVLEMLAPGLDKSDININLTSDTLEIVTNKEDLSKTLALPIKEKFKIYKAVDPECTTAKLDKGILEITMPVKQKFHKRKVTIS